MEEKSIEELSPRGEIFRSKLIEDFQLLDILGSKGNIEVPRYHSNEIQDPVIMKKLLKESPHSLVKFQINAKRDELMYNDRRLNRVRNKNRIPFGPWARSVTESPKVQNLIMFLIMANSIVLGIQAEISDKKGPTINWIKVILNVFDYITLVVFVLEILIKWIDGFWIFWDNGWNIFDFSVTAMSVVPEVINLLSGGKSSSQISVIGENMRVFKILRSLKMVSRFAQLRIIVLTIFKAFKSMAFILILLMLFMYIFAVAGTIIFDSYSKSERTDLKYKNSFSTLDNAFITLFQLFTLDHWYEILQDMFKVVNPVIVETYIMLWICIGAFIFRNIFAGIMVNNFQNIRNDFNEQIKQQVAAKEMAEIRTHLAEELEKQDRRLSISRKQLHGKRAHYVRFFQKSMANAMDTPTLEPFTINQEEQAKITPRQAQFLSALQDKVKMMRSKECEAKPVASVHTYEAKGNEENVEDSERIEDIPDINASKPDFITQDSTKVEFSKVADKNESQSKSIDVEDPKTAEQQNEPEIADWVKTVEANLQNLQRYPMETLWPRDTLFEYFQLMESLQENLIERKQLMKLLVESLLRFHDSKKKPS